MVQIVLQSKVTFLGMQNYEWTHIKIKGRGIIITELDRHAANDLILSEKLQLVPPDECDGYKNGWIYTDGKFKDYVNRHKRIKTHLEHLINELDG